MKFAQGCFAAKGSLRETDSITPVFGHATSFPSRHLV